MKKMLLAAVCLSMFGSAFAIRDEDEDAGMSITEKVIFAVDKLAVIDKQLPRLKDYMSDAKKATDSLERAYAGVKVLAILYDNLVKPVLSLLDALTSVKALAKNAKVQKVKDAISSLNKELATIPSLASDLKDVIKAKEAAAKEALAA